MKKTYAFINTSLIVASLAVSSAAQSPSGQTASGSGSPQSQGQPQSGTQSGQGSGSSSNTTRRDTDRDKTANALKGTDRTFLLDAMEGNRAEVELAQLAQQKADSQAVRELARMIETHHDEANQKLTSIASQVSAASNDTELTPQHKQLHQRLSRLEGAEFDRTYATEMVKDHQKDIQSYEKAIRQLQHADLKAYAAATLPTLKQHLEMARTAQSQAASPKTR